MSSVYEFDKSAPWVTFIFYPGEFSINTDEIQNVYVKGSFTGWKEYASWFLNYSEKGFWSLTKHVDDVQVPGNTGFPEFKFYVILKNGTSFEPDLTDVAQQNGLRCINGNMLLTESSIPAKKYLELEEAKKITAAPVPLSSYNLSRKSDREKISNTRKVPGTDYLFRGYHPYKKSRPEFDTEDTRIKYVNEFLEANRVNSIITLCGKEALDESVCEFITPYVSEIQNKGNQCFIDTSYETVYFGSNTKEYGETVAQIVRFINKHPAPYYIHCRLGSDRTGTMSAVLASLCGAGWSQIAKDYERTSQMGIMEYRNRELLAYMFSHILKVHPKKIKNLKDEMEKYFVSHGFLKSEEIAELRSRLCAE